MFLSATEQSNDFILDFDYLNLSLAQFKHTFTSSVTLTAENTAQLGSALHLTCLSQMIQWDR